ncbi:MAG: PIN domain-containing protein [Desulfobacterales bacterium]|nr:PIN domain-containing protein [Desulfobacterales bacterium]
MFLSDLEDGFSIFVDANIFIYHFCKKSKLNLASSNLLERAERAKINGVTSTSVVQEATHRMMIAEAATILPDIKAKDLVQYLKAHPDIVKELVSHQSIPEKIASFNLEIISPDINSIERSQQMKRRYGLLSNDALSLQIMEDLKINNLASNDSDFERANFITFYKPSVRTESPE